MGNQTFAVALLTQPRYTGVSGPWDFFDSKTLLRPFVIVKLVPVGSCSWSSTFLNLEAIRIFTVLAIVYWCSEVIQETLPSKSKISPSARPGVSQKNHAPARIRNASSTAGNSMASSERPSPEPILKKEASPAVLGGREFWKRSGSLKCLEI